MNKEKYQKLREKIIEAVPDIDQSYNAHTCGKAMGCTGCEKERIERYREITLSDVLMALGKKLVFWHDGGGRLLFFDDIFKKEDIVWNLKETLENQTDEVKEFLYNLLVK